MVLFSQRLLWGPMTRGVQAYVAAWCKDGVWSPSVWPDWRRALVWPWDADGVLQGARISVGALWCVSSFKSEEEQLKCQVVLKHPTGRSGTYMQFKLEGRDVCASGQLKGKCRFSNLLQMEMSSQLGWRASPRDQAAGKRFGSGSRAAGGPALLPSPLPTTHQRERTRNPVCTSRVSNTPIVF